MNGNNNVCVVRGICADARELVWVRASVAEAGAFYAGTRFEFGMSSPRTQILMAKYTVIYLCSSRIIFFYKPLIILFAERATTEPLGEFGFNEINSFH